MRIAKVIALAVSGTKNRVFESGATVNENNFHQGVFDQYIESGHIALEGDNSEKANPEVGEVERVKKPKKEVVVEAIEEAKEEVPVEDGEEDESGDDATKKEIMEQLDELGVAYKKTMTKKELYDLWKAGK